MRSGASEQEKKKMAESSQNIAMERRELRAAVQSDRVEEEFESLALKLFRHQAKYNRIYQKYVNLLNVRAENVRQMEDIPFLPISFFKSHQVVTGAVPRDAIIFKSSGTSGQQPSQHTVFDEEWYMENARRGFSDAFASDLKDVFF